MADIHVDYAAPSNDSVDFITLFYRFRADVQRFEDVERADHAQIRFRLTPGDAEYRFADGIVQRAGEAHLIGPTMGAFHVRAAGPVLVFGAGVTPLGWTALVGNEVSTMVNRVVDLADLFGNEIADVLPQLRAASGLDEMVRCGEAAFRRLVSVRRACQANFIHIVDTWLSEDRSPEIDALAAATGMSVRQLERKCKALYGAGPKALARKYRALRAAVSLVTEGVSVADVISSGFYDQSHLIREIKHFTGFTPGQIRAEPGILAQLTIARGSALREQGHPIVSDT